MIAAPAAEAMDGPAVTVEVLEDTVRLGADAPETASRLEDPDYAATTFPTAKFRKAGGSVCCLTLSLDTPK